MDTNGMWREVTALLAAYALGCFSAGYYLVRLKTGGDVRDAGSGSAGATNVGRQLGGSGFVLTLLIDGLKGALAVVLAEGMGLEDRMRWGALGAAVAGHIWPVQLGFRGGKGVATLLGGLLALDPRLLLALGALFVVTWLPGRRFAPAGLIALGLLPVAAWWLTDSRFEPLATAGLVLLILVAHQENIRRDMASRFESGRPKPNQGPARPPPDEYRTPDRL